MSPDTQAILESLTADHVLAAAKALDQGVPHAFHESTKFDVLIGSRRYPPKAVVGVAARLATGVELVPADFPGGLGSMCFRVLNQVGFRIVEKWNVTAPHYFIPGRLYSRARDVHDTFGGNRQSGIVTIDSCPYIFLFTSETGANVGYADGWTGDGMYLYSGEGQKGDQVFSRGNKAIRDHVGDGKTLELFESLGKGKNYRYVGSFFCASWEERQSPDINGFPRTVIIFQLAPTAQEQDAESEKTDFPTSFEELRRQAYRAACTSQVPIGQVIHNAFRRSALIKSYVLRRAKGMCESCREPAPFVRKDGSPYLEPHHTRRVSDAGPDHPRWVGAICPNCHREIHSGIEGDARNNSLIDYLGELESDSPAEGDDELASS